MPGKLPRLVGYLLSTVCAVALLTGCSLPETADLTTENYDLSEFSTIQIDGLGQVTITQGEINSLTVIAESSIQSMLIFSVQNDTLRLGLSDDVALTRLDPQNGIQMLLTVNGIKSLQQAGSCSVVGTGLTGKTLQISHEGVGSLSLTDIRFETVELALSGSGSVVINGTVDKQNIVMNGSVRYFGADTPSRIINASLDGHTQASVWVTSVLNVEAPAGTKFEFYGAPPDLYLGKTPENITMLGEK